MEEYTKEKKEDDREISWICIRSGIFSSKETRLGVFWDAYKSLCFYRKEIVQPKDVELIYEEDEIHPGRAFYTVAIKRKGQEEDPINRPTLLLEMRSLSCQQ